MSGGRWLRASSRVHARKVEVTVSAQTGEGMDALLAAIDEALFYRSD